MRVSITMKYLIALSLVIVAGAAIYSITNRTNGIVENTQENAQTLGTSTVVLFPAGGEVLEQGEDYTLRWIGGSNPTTIFLIDTSLTSQGASVAISDRVYGIKNTSSYTYRIPETMKPGDYFFQVDNATSAVFHIVESR